MGTGESEQQGERERPRAVLHHDPATDPAPLVWWWDGERWHGPRESGDYGARSSQSRSRS